MKILKMFGGAFNQLMMPVIIINQKRSEHYY